MANIGGPEHEIGASLLLRYVLQYAVHHRGVLHELCVQLVPVVAGVEDHKVGVPGLDRPPHMFVGGVLLVPDCVVVTPHLELKGRKVSCSVPLRSSAGAGSQLQFPCKLCKQRALVICSVNPPGKHRGALVHQEFARSTEQASPTAIDRPQT